MGLVGCEARRFKTNNAGGGVSDDTPDPLRRVTRKRPNTDMRQRKQKEQNMAQCPLFDLGGKVAVVTGGAGVLGGAIARGLADAGADVAIADVAVDAAERQANEICSAGGTARPYEMDVFKRDSIQACCEKVYADFGTVDILVNCVGGNMKAATTSAEQSFFDIPADAFRKVIDLNLIGGVIVPSQVFGAQMKANPRGASIINISSMNALRPLTRIPGYSAAKAAVSNFTQWLAVHLAQEYSRKLRVNAIAPGFFLMRRRAS